MVEFGKEVCRVEAMLEREAWLRDGRAMARLLWDGFAEIGAMPVP